MKIGILGGTFNPVHLGHIRLAEGALDKLFLDKLVFIPAYMPPHKPGEGMISPEDRYRMVELAVEGLANIEVSDIEMRVKEKSYSINTVKKLKDIYGDHEIYFIAGSDYADELDTWKEIDSLKKLCSFVIATRPGYKLESPPENTRSIEIATPDISSTNIRKRIRAAREFKELVPEKVYGYIKDRGLYL